MRLETLQGRHILVLTDFLFPDGYGGANKVAYHTACGLMKAGADVRLVVRKANSNLSARTAIAGMEVYRYELGLKTAGQFLRRARVEIRQFLDSIFKEAGRPVDLVIAHQPLPAVAGSGHPLLKPAGWIYNFHSPWEEEYRLKALRNGSASGFMFWTNRLLRRFLEFRVLRRCQHVIVLSRFMQERLESIHGFAPRSTVIPGGVETDRFAPARDRDAVRKTLGLPKDKIVLLTVRNLRPRTGIENLLRAMTKLGETACRVHLVIVGTGELEHELKQMAVDERLGDRLRFAGRVPEKDLPAYYQAADVFVLPTEALEGFGMVTAEALASGLPVIGTPVGATPEILSRLGAEWITADPSASAIAEKIRERLDWLANHSADLRTLRGKCRHIAEVYYSWPGILQRWKKVCEDCLPHR